VFFAYIGPETFLPLTSVVAAVAGVALMLGRNSLRFVVGLAAVARRLVRGPRTAATPNPAGGRARYLASRRAEAVILPVHGAEAREEPGD
jgi:hypothetical protein